MKLTYTLQEVKPNVFVVLLEDNYNLPMLFCRVQEFYESPNEDFRNKKFSIWEYMEWYSKNGKGSFTYPSDWAGFNIPYPVLRDCMEVHFPNKEFENPYDSTMYEIYETLKSRGTDNIYILGTQTNEGDTFNHEVCHGLFFTNPKYKEKALEFVDSIDKDIMENFRQNLLNIGYTDSVVKDEVQAYLLYGHDKAFFTKNVNKRKVNSLHKKLSTIMSVFLTENVDNSVC
jgi:hypothetical protein